MSEEEKKAFERYKKLIRKLFDGTATQEDQLTYIELSIIESLIENIKQNYISKSMLKEIKKSYKQIEKKAHPASDIVFIDWLEDRIKFIDDLLEEKE